MNQDVIEGEAREIVPVQSKNELAAWTPRFAVAVDEAIERKQEKRRFFEKVMDPDLHYGVIPGTKGKPTLLKPGAEMLLSNMGLSQELSDAEPPIRDYDGTAEGHGEPLIAYRRVCRIYRQTGAHEQERMLISQAEGFCTSREEKYRYRSGARLCPECGKPAIIKGKAEYGGGFLCFKKKDGCGAKFDDQDSAIVSQPEGKVPNPNVADVENTILKMADKRALVAATLLATGCSDIFTQDVEDSVGDESVPPTVPPPMPADKGGASGATRGSSGSNPGRRAQGGASTAGKAEKFRFAHAPPQAQRSEQIVTEKMQTPAEDPVTKGRAIETVLDVKRRFPRGQWRQFMIDTVGTVNDGDLTVDDLERLRIAAEERIEALTPEPKYAEAIEDELPL